MLLAVLALDLEAHDRAVRPVSKLAGEIVTHVLRRGTRIERPYPGQGFVDVLAVHLDDNVTRLETGIGRLSDHMGDDELVLDQSPCKWQRMTPVDKLRVVHRSMTIAQRGQKTAERVDKYPCIGIGRRSRQRGHQGARPVSLDHVEIRIKVLEHIPSERDSGQPRGTVIA